MEEEFVPISSYLLVVWRRKLLVILVTAAVVIAVGIKLFFYTPVTYKAEGTLISRAPSGGASSMAALSVLGQLAMGGASGGGAKYDTASVLESRTLAEKIVDSNNLLPVFSREYNRKFSREGLIKSLKDSVGLEPDKSGAMTVFFYAKSPRLAADMVNIYMKAILLQLVDMNRMDSSEKSNYLEKQIARNEDNLKRVEEELKDFEEKKNIVSIDKDAEQALSGYYNIKLQYEKDKIDRETLLKQLDMRQRVYNNSDPVLLKKEVYMADSTLQALKGKMTEAQLELLKNQSILKPDSAVINQNLMKLDTINKEMKKYTSTIQTNLSNDLLYEMAVADSRISAENTLISSYEKMFSTVPESKMRYARLLRDQKLFEQIYLYLKQEYERAKLDQQNTDTPLHILDTSLPPEKRYSPKRGLGLVIAVFAGFSLGVLIAFVLDLIARTNKAAEAATAK